MIIRVDLFKHSLKCWQRHPPQFWPWLLPWRPDTFPRHGATNGKWKAIKWQLESCNRQGLHCTQSNSHLKSFPITLLLAHQCSGWWTRWWLCGSHYISAQCATSTVFSFASLACRCSWKKGINIWASSALRVCTWCFQIVHFPLFYTMPLFFQFYE